MMALCLLYSVCYSVSRAVVVYSLISGPTTVQSLHVTYNSEKIQYKENKDTRRSLRMDGCRRVNSKPLKLERTMSRFRHTGILFQTCLNYNPFLYFHCDCRSIHNIVEYAREYPHVLFAYRFSIVVITGQRVLSRVPLDGKISRDRQSFLLVLVFNPRGSHEQDTHLSDQSYSIIISFIMN